MTTPSPAEDAPAMTPTLTAPLPLAAPGRARRAYLALLNAAFPLFSTLRIASYLPTLWAIHASRDSSQHSLWTWGIWLGANLTMAGWLHEQGGGRISAAIALSLSNAVMCAAAFALIAWYRAVA